MTRNDLINRLVDRKMTRSRPAKAFCVCMAAPARKLCWAAAKKHCWAQANSKN